MKKLSKINESLWKPSINRAKSGELRGEDIIKTNIKEFKEIDLGDFCPFYIADINLEIEGEELISFERYLECKDQIMKTGWRMPTSDEWKEKVMSHVTIVPNFNDEDFFLTWGASLHSKYNDKKVRLYDGMSRMMKIVYWLEYGEYEEEFYTKGKKTKYAPIFDMHLKGSYRPDVQWKQDFKEIDTHGIMIRLIKDKK